MQENVPCKLITTAVFVVELERVEAAKGQGRGRVVEPELGGVDQLLQKKH